MDRTELVELIDQALTNSDGTPDTASRIADCVMQKYILIHQDDDESGPLNKDFLAAWHVRDRMYADLADIKIIPASDSDIQFKMPDIRSKPDTPTGTVDFIPQRLPNESVGEWGSRCVIMENVGDLK